MLIYVLLAAFDILLRFYPFIKYLLDRFNRFEGVIVHGDSAGLQPDGCQPRGTFVLVEFLRGRIFGIHHNDKEVFDLPVINLLPNASPYIQILNCPQADIICSPPSIRWT